MFVSRDVQFHEQIFPFSKTSQVIHNSALDLLGTDRINVGTADIDPPHSSDLPIVSLSSDIQPPSPITQPSRKSSRPIRRHFYLQNYQINFPSHTTPYPISSS